MNDTTRYVVSGVAGLVVGGAIAWAALAPRSQQATCAIVPVSGNASYGFYLADANGGSRIALGTLYLEPGGFKHNIAFYNPAVSVGGAPLKTYDVGPPCTPGTGTATLPMMDSSSGTPVQVGTVTFNSTPTNSNATYGVTIATSNGILPIASMSGDAYLMQ